MYIYYKKKIKINGKLFAVFVLFRLDPDQARHSAGPDLRYADDIKKKKKKSVQSYLNHVYTCRLMHLLILTLIMRR